MIKKGDYIFVYGTLRRGERADLSREGGKAVARFIGEDRINGDLYNLGWFPGVKLPEGHEGFSAEHHAVVGDVFSVPNEALGVILDAYEGYPGLYGRQKVRTEKGKSAWVYTYNGEVSDRSLIPSGDWKAREFKTVLSSDIIRA